MKQLPGGRDVRRSPDPLFPDLCYLIPDAMGHAEFTLRTQPSQKPLSLDELWMPFTPNRDFKSDPRIIVRAEGM